MAEYRLKISGVHYGANGDFVAGQKDTEETHVRTRELLSWIDRERPLVVLSPDPANHIHERAVQARALGRRIGRVAFECVDKAWRLLRSSGQPMMMARVREVVVRNHGYVVVTVNGDDLQAPQTPPTAEIEWKEWTSDLPLLPPSEQIQAEQEAAYVIDHMFLPHLAETDIRELKRYLDIWLQGSQHDLSREARQKRSYYIEQLEATQDKDVRLLAEPLKEQRTRMCERERLDELTTTWWAGRMTSAEMQLLWRQWRLRHGNRLWTGLRHIDALLRQLPGELYGDIAELDVVLSRLYYMNTPRQAFQAIMGLMMLRSLTCRELGIEMRPMAADEYQQDGRVTNPLEMPTTIGRVLEFGKSQCNETQRQTIGLLAHWLRDDYEQRHCEEIEALATDVATRLAENMEKAAARPTYGAYYASGAHHDDKRRQLLLGEESEKGDSIKRLSK